MKKEVWYPKFILLYKRRSQSDGSSHFSYLPWWREYWEGKSSMDLLAFSTSTLYQIEPVLYLRSLCDIVLVESFKPSSISIFDISSGYYSLTQFRTKREPPVCHLTRNTSLRRNIDEISKIYFLLVAVNRPWFGVLKMNSNSGNISQRGHHFCNRWRQYLIFNKFSGYVNVTRQPYYLKSSS